MSESAINVFLTWIEHRLVTIWSREPFGFERESSGDSASPASREGEPQ